jgi:hypothetical protein
MNRPYSLVICIAFLSSCTADTADSGVDDPNDLVRVESLLGPGFVPPSNPTTDEETPNELNQGRVVRYSPDGDVAPRAIVVAMPGFLGGAPSFDGIARTLVRKCTSE